MPGFELIGKEEKQAVAEIFDDGGVLFAHGFDAIRNNRYRVREFEKKFADSIGVKYAQAVSSGTAALKSSLVALGVKPGDEVITQAFTFIATVEAIVDVGAIPIIVNIDSTYNMDPIELEKAITSKTKVIIPVHMLGVAADLEKILKISKKYKIPILDDNCESVGAEWNNEKLGIQSDMCTWSFDYGKTITCGEGGMITTNSEELYHLVREYHDHGHQYNMSLPRGLDTRRAPGFNYRMSEMQAAVGMAQLEKLDYIVVANRKNYKVYSDALHQIDQIQIRKIPVQCKPLCDTFIFALPEEKQTLEFLKLMNKENIGTKNVPDAIEWHFARHWDHIFTSYGISKEELISMTQTSADLLKRSVSIPVMVNTPKDVLKRNADKLVEIAQLVL